jgi:hypothetical protein
MRDNNLGLPSAARMAAEVVFSLCAPTHPLHTIFSSTVGTSLREKTVRPNPVPRTREAAREQLRHLRHDLDVVPAQGERQIEHVYR